jgi:hypothetical protein
VRTLPYDDCYSAKCKCPAVIRTGNIPYGRPALTNELVRHPPNLIMPNFKIKIYSPPSSLTSITSEKSWSGEIRSISTHGMDVVIMIESEKRNAAEQENWRQDAANRIMMTANFMSAFFSLKKVTKNKQYAIRVE